MDFKEWLIRYLERKLGRDYKGIKANVGEERYEFKGHYPDLILESHGITVGLMQVETDETLKDPERPKLWRELSGLGPKLTLVIPAYTKAKVTELLWNEGLAGKVSVATYDLLIKMGG